MVNGYISKHLPHLSTACKARHAQLRSHRIASHRLHQQKTSVIFTRTRTKRTCFYPPERQELGLNDFENENWIKTGTKINSQGKHSRAPEIIQKWKWPTQNFSFTMLHRLSLCTVEALWSTQISLSQWLSLSITAGVDYNPRPPAEYNV